jgi:hypothetical protein
VYQAGTLSANPVSMRAGLATLEQMAQRDGWTTLDDRRSHRFLSRRGGSGFDRRLGDRLGLGDRFGLDRGHGLGGFHQARRRQNRRRRLDRLRLLCRRWTLLAFDDRRLGEHVRRRQRDVALLRQTLDELTGHDFLDRARGALHLDAVIALEERGHLLARGPEKLSDLEDPNSCQQ